MSEFIYSWKNKFYWKLHFNKLFGIQSLDFSDFGLPLVDEFPFCMYGKEQRILK